MSLRVALNHKTVYHYDRPVALSPQVIRLRPAVHSRTPILSYSLRVTPEDHFINWQQDPFGNILARVVFQQETRTLGIEVDLIAEMVVINPFDFFVEEYAKHFPFTYDRQLRKELTPYMEVTENGPLLRKWLSGVERGKRPYVVDFLVDLNSRLQRDIGYLIRMEPGIQSCEETLKKPPVRAGIRLGCWSRSCATSVWPHALSPVIWFSSNLMSGHWTAPPGPKPISRICMPGAKCMSPARAGSASIPLPGCSLAKAISRWPARRIR